MCMNCPKEHMRNSSALIQTVCGTQKAFEEYFCPYNESHKDPQGSPSIETKSLSRKVCSHSGYICNASRQLFRPSKSKSYLNEWGNPEILKNCIAELIIKLHELPQKCFSLCSNRVRKTYFFSGWTSQCTCAVISTSLMILWETELLTAAAVMQWLYQSMIGSFI